MTHQIKKPVRFSFSIMFSHRFWFFLLLLLLPTQLGYHVWPSWANVLGRRVDYLSLTLYVTDILIACTVITWALSQRNFFRAAASWFWANRMTGAIVLMFAVINISASARFQVSLYAWGKAFEYALLAAYIYFTKPSTKHIMLPLAIGVIYEGILACVQFGLQRSVGGLMWWIGERSFTSVLPGIARLNWWGQEIIRPYATLPHPNVLGGWMAVLLPSLIQEYSNKRERKKRTYRTLYLAAAGIAAVTLCVSFSRSAWVVACIGIGVITVCKKRDTRKSVENKVLALASLATCVFLLVLVLMFRPAVVDESVVQRITLIKSSVQMMKDSPLTGVGLGNFLVRLPDVTTQRTINFLQPVNTIYLLFLAEVGILGAVVFLFVVYHVFKIRRKPSQTKANRTPWSLATVLILLLGCVDHYPVSLQQGQLLFTVIGALALGKYHNPSASAR